MNEITGIINFALGFLDPTWRQPAATAIGLIIIGMVLLALAKRLGLFTGWRAPPAGTTQPSAQTQSGGRQRVNIPESAAKVIQGALRGQFDVSEVLRVVDLLRQDREARDASTPIEGTTERAEEGLARLTSGPAARQIAEQLYQNVVTENGATDAEAKAAFVKTVTDILTQPAPEELEALRLLAENKKEEAFQLLGQGSPNEQRLRALTALQAPADKALAAESFNRLVATTFRPFAASGLVACYSVEGVPDVQVGIIAGDIREVHNIDVWVNSENDWLVMAKMMEGSVSGSIRYLSAKSDANGLPLNDPMQKLLRPKAYGPIKQRPLGSTMITGAGNLKTTNNVKKVVHVVSVTAAPLRHVKPGPDPDIYVASAIGTVDRHNKNWLRGFSGGALKSMIVPPFGTGQGRVDPRQIADQLVKGLITGMRRRTNKSSLRRVYLLAYSTREFVPLKAALDAAVAKGELNAAPLNET